MQGDLTLSGRLLELKRDLISAETPVTRYGNCENGEKCRMDEPFHKCLHLLGHMVIKPNKKINSEVRKIKLDSPSRKDTVATFRLQI